MTKPIQRKKPLGEKEESSTINKQGQQSKDTSSLFKALVTSLLWIIFIFFITSQLITESWTWGYEGKWTNINNYIPRKETVISEEQLMRYDGTDSRLPIYIAIDGDVYDVSTGSGWYAPGGSYHHFAGRDAARAYVTGCFKEHITHDLRGLTNDQLKGIEHWKKFYQNHRSYFRVGRVLHPPIDDSTPIPTLCASATKQKPTGK
ncbi:cytochrome b5-like heme/steroid binding domain-containing protein [Spinellus fusiger]|nr:cytochrome b5-like heme/steroid binding domain-containing protein [Spinellus fusiger]